MPISALAAAGISAGIGLATTGANQAISAGRTRRARHWQVQQIDQQYRRDLENREYNDPSNQMARLKEAGLNPHLVYGKGNVQNQSTLKAPSTPGVAQQAPANFQLDALSELGKYYANKTQAATARKTEAEADVAQATVQDMIDKKSWELDMLKYRTTDLGEHVSAKKKAEWYKMQTEIDRQKLELGNWRAKLREHGATESDDWSKRYAISRYSGDAKALNRVLTSLAIAEGVGGAIPKNVLGILTPKRKNVVGKETYNEATGQGTSTYYKYK